MLHCACNPLRCPRASGLACVIELDLNLGAHYNRQLILCGYPPQHDDIR